MVASALGPGKELLDLICLVTLGIILRDFGLAEHHDLRGQGGRGFSGTRLA
jgi:hypothetical protein